MKLYNTLTRQIEDFTPLNNNTVHMYSCGPTVYDRVHIGNLSAYIFADTLHRALTLEGRTINHVMNYTDVDDKTIRRSREKYPNKEPRAALHKLTTNYIGIFLDEMRQIGVDTDDISFMRATDNIDAMQALITKLHQDGFAYIAGDGVYFSIDAYRKSGKKYGQLLDISASNTSEARIQNDEYDKESVHDFALWKKQKDGEPGWDFTLDEHDLKGRPGWHVECSAMSREGLGQPFDIHTGGVDLIFPHHENEIAQSTAGEENPVMAQVFAHNEHILVDGKKMSKSLQNFHTLEDVTAKGIDPLAFRLMVLQAHYRSQVNFSWENLESAQNRLKNWRAFADLRFQAKNHVEETTALRQITLDQPQIFVTQQLADDLNTPLAITWLDRLSDEISVVPESMLGTFQTLLQFFDSCFGLKFCASRDVTDEQKQILHEREEARIGKDWTKSDELRDQLAAQGIGVRDTQHGTIWFRL